MARTNARTFQAHLEGLLDDLAHGVVSANDCKAAFHAALRGSGQTHEEVLAALSDETRVEMINRDVLRRQAFEQLMVVKYQPRLINWFSRRTNGNRTLAEDLTQDIMVKLWLARPIKFDRQRASFYTWLMSVCRNHLCQTCRRRRVFTRAPENLPEDGDKGPSPLDVASGREEAANLAVAVDRLREPDRSIYRLRLQGAKFEKIADVVGLSIARVHNLLERATQSLRKDLGVES
jgi:RNA polymerase sigma-70 factor (ECF subfamily)